MTRALRQSIHSYLRTLQELKRRAVAKEKLRAVDSDETGNKYTECTLGLCDESIEQSMDGIYRDDTHACPNDRRYFTPSGARRDNPEPSFLGAGSGCFYSCMIFKPKVADDRKKVYERITTMVDATALIHNTQENKHGLDS